MLRSLWQIWNGQLVLILFKTENRREGMKKENILIFILTVILTGLITSLVFRRVDNNKPEIAAAVSQSIPLKKDKKLLYYRNPMNPEITSPVAMKDPMGMDYVAVYEDESGVQQTGIQISPEKQQLVGIETEKVIARELVHIIRTVGKIAYDPDLYVAQEEYIQAFKTFNAVKNSELVSVSEQSAGLLAAAGKKLRLLGMTHEEIDVLAKKGSAQGNLYLPEAQEPVWAYLAIHEQDIGLIKNGMPVEIDAVAFPGETFNGAIASINPVLDPVSRSARARVEVVNPDNKLKPEMYVNARIDVPLGNHLAAPKVAVMDTGERQLVFIAKPGGYFESREIKIGNEAGDYYEVVSGLKEGEEVVSAGNFFVDSESKLKSTQAN